MNARSIVNKLHIFHSYISDLQPDIISVTETWANKNFNDALFQISGFKLFRSDRRSGSRGGGVCLYIKDSLQSCALDVANSSNFSDCVWAEVYLQNKSSILVGVVYRPPNSSVANDSVLFELFHEASSLPHQFKLISGDFNFPHIDWETLSSNKDSEDFLVCTVESGFYQTVFEPTREEHILDLLFCSTPDLVTRVDVIEPLASSDHNMVLAELAFSAERKPISSKSTPRYNFKQADWDLYRSILASNNWESCFQHKDVNEIWASFQSAIHGALSSAVPTMNYLRSNRPPWDSPEIRSLKLQRRRAERIFLDTRSEEARRLRNHTSNLLKQAIRRSIYNFESSLANSDNPKRFWNYVKSKQKVRSTVGPLVDPSTDRVVYDPLHSATILGDSYKSAFTSESLPIPAVHTQTDHCLADVVFTPDRIRFHLSHKKNFSSPGPDGIQYICYKQGAFVLLPLLARLFQIFFELGNIPLVWKHALVTPIHKKGCRKKAENYRPVSLTCTASKLMESIVRDHLWQFWNQYDIIKRSQFGFRSNSSSTHQLLEFLEDLTSVVDRGQWADVIYLDFEKAFNSVPHFRLLSKLTSLGIGGRLLCFLKAFLEDRTESVVVDGVHSSPYSMISGVPQGSVLGPDLFVAFINDIDDTLTNSSLLKYADDVKLHSEIKHTDPLKAKELLQADLNAVTTWSKKWQLSLNPQKCSILHFGFRNPASDYRLDGSFLNNSKCVKDLGVLISKDLKFSRHILTCVQKANRIVSAILRTFVSRDADLLIRLFKTLVRPHLEYAIPVWNPSLNKDILAIERVQRRFTKSIRGLSSLPYEERLRALKLPTLQCRRRIMDLTTVFKICNHLTPSDPNSFFTFSVSRTRGHNYKIFRHPTNLNCRLSSFSHRIIDDWNRLPDDIVNSETVKQFKRKLFMFYCNF